MSSVGPTFFLVDPILEGKTNLGIFFVFPCWHVRVLWRNQNASTSPAINVSTSNLES
jgi:hypothetical protein